MSHKTRLKKQHLQILLEAIHTSREYKLRNLRNPSSKDLMIQQYRKAEDRLCSEIEIECGKRGHQANDNLFGWIRDQIFHSGKLDETELGKNAIDICEAAGDNCYEQFCKHTIFNSLFE